MRSLTLSPKTVLPAVVLAFTALCALSWWGTRPVTARSEGSDQPGEVMQPPAPTPPPVASANAAQRPAAPAKLPAPSPAEQQTSSTAPAHSLRAETPPPPPEPEHRPMPGSSANANVPSTDESEPAVRKDEIKAAVVAVVPLIRQCFEDVAERYPGNHKVVLKFTIVGQGLTGHFKDGEVVDSTIPDPWLQACFLDSLTDARFPAPSGGGTVTVTYPFAFIPDPEDAGSGQGR